MDTCWDVIVAVCIQYCRDLSWLQIKDWGSKNKIVPRAGQDRLCMTRFIAVISSQVNVSAVRSLIFIRLDHLPAALHM